MAERVFTSIGRADLIDNPRYRTNANRVAHAEELDAIIGEFIAKRTQAENVAFFEEAEVTIVRSTTSRRSSRTRTSSTAR